MKENILIGKIHILCLFYLWVQNGFEPVQMFLGLCPKNDISWNDLAFWPNVQNVLFSPKTIGLVRNNFEPVQNHFGPIRMSHWRHTMVDGAKFWISYQWLAFLSIFSRWQLIQNLAPSTIEWRQYDIRIEWEFSIRIKNATSRVISPNYSLLHI